MEAEARIRPAARPAGAAAASRVLVLGASGTMGRRIVALLRREAPELRVIGASRHPERIGTPEARRLDLADPASFAPALDGVRVLVHAAGPYDHDPRGLVAACLARGVDYVDLAEDPAFIARVEAAARGAAVRSRVVPGCSTVPGMVALLARRFDAIARRDEVVRVEAHLSLGSRNPVSFGLLYGLLRPLGAPGAEGVRWFRALRRFEFADGLRRSFGAYPIALGEGVALGDRRVPVRLFVGFDRGFVNLALAQAARVVPRLEARTLARLARWALPVANAARVVGGAQGRLSVDALDAGGRRLATLEVRAHREGLDVPAAPALWAAQRLAEGAEIPPGVRPLEEIVPLAEALDHLRKRGYTVVER
jgi:uncharacterized protein YbjT (DUF2867 family)